MRNFKEFLNHKSRESKKQLKSIYKILDEQGLKVADHLDNDDPYLFVKNSTNQKTSFSGLRIYKIGDNIAYRIQREEKTHPYGMAYLLDIENAFNDLLGDMKEEEALKEVMKGVKLELETFFKKSSEAEVQIKKTMIEPGNMSKISDIGRGGVTDYGSTIFTSL
jgi:nitrogenase molybdenum-iron protein alpha/beta subunit